MSESESAPDEPAMFSISPEEMTAILCEAATKERCVVEFQTRERPDGTRELHQAMEVTDHIQKLEEMVDEGV